MLWHNMAQEVLASPLLLFYLFPSNMDLVLRYFLYLENQLLKCCIMYLLSEISDSGTADMS